MINLNLYLIIIFLLSCSASQPKGEISSHKKSSNEIIDIINKLKVGMSAQDLLSKMIPISENSPCFKDIGPNKIKYYFKFESNRQLWVEVSNPKNLLPLGPSTPNGKITSIGKIEPLEIWVFKNEDSNQIK